MPLPVPSGLHTLRHTAVTLLVTQGTDIRTVAGIAGHSSPMMTLNVYGHLVESAARTGSDRLGATLEQLANEGDCNRFATAATARTKKPRNHAVLMVAPTGIETEADGNHGQSSVLTDVQNKLVG
jgi:integrase